MNAPEPPGAAAPAVPQAAPSDQGELPCGELRVQKPRRAAPADAVRPTRAEVNLGNLRHNLRVVERAVGRAAAAPGQGATGMAHGPEVWGVLKADAYGHGAPAVARTLERAGISGLCVALLEEALELRAAGIQIPIIAMGGYYGPQHRGLEEIVEGDITPVLYHQEQIERLGRLARERGSGPSPFHLKVDTGMARLGVRPEELGDLLDRIVGTPGVHLAGLMSHLASADASDPAPTLAQLAQFELARGEVRRRKLSPRHCHVANSAAALGLPGSRYDAVRPGLALYGVSPFFGSGSSAQAPAPPPLAAPFLAELRPTMRVRTEVVALRTLASGDRVGYGQTWTADGPRRVATIPMGYADGLARALSNRGFVLIRGRRAPIAGVVSMDLTSVDVTDSPGVVIGDEVVVLGPQEGPLGCGAITAEEIADITATIPWEVITSISRRVPRFFREP